MPLPDQQDVRARGGAGEPGPVLVVVRGAGPEDTDAVALAGRLAHMSGGPLVAVQVIEAARGARDRNADRAARLRVAQARALVAAVLPECPDTRVVAVAGPSLAREIHAIALDMGAQLIAVGSERDGVGGRVRLDRWTASTVVLNAPCPIAVAPSGFRARIFPDVPSVGVAFDGAAESLAALHTAHALARGGGTLRVIAVEAGEPGPAVDDALAALGDEVPIRLTVPHGDPAARLAEASEHLDLLVCASRGRRPLRRLALGRVPLLLMRSASCPVLIVPPGVPAVASTRSIA